jgi:alpha-ketoglutarate-dependent taurine dioxygenase
MSVAVNKIEDSIGVAITGMTGQELVDRDAADRTQALLDEHGVVVYREIHIDDDDLLAFSRLLGKLVIQPTGEHKYPEIQTITSDPAKTSKVMAEYRKGNFVWHVDGAMDDIPQKGTLLTAREVADADQGDTEFATTYAAYDALTDGEKAEIAELRVLHSFAHAQGLANPEASEKKRAQWAQIPTKVHPLVWTRRNGRKSLLIGATAAEVVGWPIDKGRALLDRLLDWSTQPRFTLRHHWHKGDLVIWDNTGMLHRALPFESTSPRLMHRTTLVGEEAVAG